MYENYSYGRKGEIFFENIINAKNGVSVPGGVRRINPIQYHAEDIPANLSRENHIKGDVSLIAIRQSDGWQNKTEKSISIEVKSTKKVARNDSPAFNITGRKRSGEKITTNIFMAEIQYKLIVGIVGFNGVENDIEQPITKFILVDAAKAKELILSDQKWIVNHRRINENDIEYVWLKDFECLGSKYYNEFSSLDTLLDYIYAFYLKENGQNESLQYMNKKQLHENIMTNIKKSLENLDTEKSVNEAVKPSDIYTDDRTLVDGSKDDMSIGSIWDDGSVKFRKNISKEDQEAYKKAILKNKKLCDRFNIQKDSFINESKNSVNEARNFDPKNNKDHKAAYNSFVKWFDRWKGKLDRDELRAMIKKVSADALGDNLDMINEAYKMPNPIVNTYTGPLPKVDSDDNALYDEETGETIATMDIKQYGYDPRSKCCIIKFKPGLSLQDKLNYRDAILKNRTLKSWFNIGKSSFIYYQPELFESHNEARVPASAEAANDHLAFDLFLTFENTREIHDMVQPMIDNLLRRLRKGQELSQEILATSSIAEKYAKATIDEYRKMNGRIIVDASTRKALKQRIAKSLIDTANDDYAFETHDGLKD